MSLAAISLDDRYALDQGRVFLTGTQALVRLPMLQRQRDAAAGLDTACYISGYRGSPLGGLDRELWRAKPFVEKARIHFQPGVNEDLAATAVWGSQQVGLFPGARHDGVFAIWYGKGPGVDRSGDALKHANMAGTAAHGGVLALAGDDHTCKSSTLPHQSEFAFMDASIPLLNPAGVQEFIDYGMVGWALSRFSGLWVGMKTVAETVDSTASVAVGPERAPITLPTDFTLPEGGLNIRWPDPPLAQELRLHRFKLAAARAFVAANALDRVTLGGRGARLGIVAAGKSYLDVRQALDDLGIDAEAAQSIGLAVYKPALTWPLEPAGLRAFADGLEEILVVEEKRAFIEPQIKEQLYDLPDGRRPRVIGKQDESGALILPSNDELTPARIARVIAARIARFHKSPAIEARLAFLEGKERALERGGASPLDRLPYFCSGCPHNTSTKVPEGSRALAGIGCHYMVLWMDRNTDTFTQMGAEGASWIGQAPFTETGHVFQNIGDGTYFHSGLLAIRAAVAAGVTMTYKLLYNDAVAMTGGQPMDGDLTVARITHQLHGEGVGRIAVVADDPGKYGRDPGFAVGVTLHPRADLDLVQRELRALPGVSLLIYDQVCATEKRRRRKRGTLPDPGRRVIINTQVCEGCGDCGLASNCLSVIPVETEFGRKRTIDQSSCNMDFSCLDGFCPSFVTVEGGALRRPAAAEVTPPGDLPEPASPSLSEPYGILITGVGGTGVVTIAALLGMAAHIEGKGVSVLDMTGLAQKYGAVVSHLRIAEHADALHAARIAAGGARLLLGCDLVVAAGFDALAKVAAETTRAVINTQEQPTGAFARDPDLVFPGAALRDRIARAAGAGHTDFIDAGRLATALIGDSIAANLLMVGHAYQKGLVPLSAAAIEQAIALNGVAVTSNLAAFRWGRALAHDPGAVEAAAAAQAPGAADEHPPADDLDTIVARRADDLAAYRDTAYARRYRGFVERARTVEAATVGAGDDLARTVARGYYKLLAYKDEYEVARLFTDGRFEARIKARFEGEPRLVFHLAPPLLARVDPATGRPRKTAYGPWIFKAMNVLARFKFLRGGLLDPFGYSVERRAERALIERYEVVIGKLLAELTPANHATAVAIAALPEQIRGFGPIKLAAIARANSRETELLAAFGAPTPEASAAE